MPWVVKPLTAMSHMLPLAQCYMIICTAVIDGADVPCLCGALFKTVNAAKHKSNLKRLFSIYTT